MKKKDKDCEKIEEEVVMLRVKVVKLSKNVEETSTSLARKLEEKCHRLPEKKNEVKPKSYHKSSKVL
jgi:hypothetical protein